MVIQVDCESVRLVRRSWVTTGWRWMAMVLIVCGGMLWGMAPESALAGPAREMELLLNTVNGQPLRLADLRGKVVVVNFWATWCPPCLEEIPELVRFHEEYGSKGVVVVGIDYMDHANLELLRAFIKKHQISYPIVYGDPMRLDRVARALGGVFGLPITKLLDRQGRVVSSHVGGVTAEDLQNWVEPLLATTAATAVAH